MLFIPNLELTGNVLRGFGLSCWVVRKCIVLVLVDYAPVVMLATLTVLIVYYVFHKVVSPNVAEIVLLWLHSPVELAIVPHLL